MDKYNKNINTLIEDILNEAKTAHIKSYDRSKKVYDEAFKKGLPLWEKKAYDAAFAKGIEEWEHGRARKKGFTPATVSDLFKGCKKDEPELYPYVRDMVNGSNVTKIGK